MLHAIRHGTPVAAEAERLAVHLWRSRQVLEILAIGETLARWSASSGLSQSIASVWLASSHWVATSSGSEATRAASVEASVAVVLDAIARLVDERLITDASFLESSKPSGIETEMNSADYFLRKRRLVAISKHVSEWHLARPGSDTLAVKAADSVAARRLEEHDAKTKAAVPGASLEEMLGSPSSTITPALLGRLLSVCMAMPHDSGIPAAVALVRVAWKRFGVLPTPQDHSLLVERSADFAAYVDSAQKGTQRGAAAGASSPHSSQQQSLPLNGPGSEPWRLVAWGEYEQATSAWLERLLGARGLREPPALARANLRQLCQMAESQHQKHEKRISPGKASTSGAVVGSAPGRVSPDRVLEAWLESVKVPSAATKVESVQLPDADSLCTAVQCLVSMGALDHAAEAIRVAQSKSHEEAARVRMIEGAVEPSSGLPPKLLADWISVFGLPKEAICTVSKALGDAGRVEDAMQLLSGEA